MLCRPDFAKALLGAALQNSTGRGRWIQAHEPQVQTGLAGPVTLREQVVCRCSFV